MNKKIMFLMVGTIFVLTVLVSIFATLYFMGNTKKTNNNDIVVEKKKMEDAFLSENYEQYKWGFRKTIKENIGDSCTTQEFYSYELDGNIFIRAELKEVNNVCIINYIKYYVALDTVEYNITTTTKTGQTISYQNYNYNYETGVNNCGNNCSYANEIRNKFMNIKNKYNINIKVFK